MPEIRFPGLAKKNDLFAQFLWEKAGYKANRDGDDWVVPANDPALLAGPKDILTVHPQVNINEENFSQSAKKLTSYVPSEFDEYVSKPPSEVFISGNLGILTELDEYTIKLAVANSSEVETVLENNILPFMFNKFGAKFVTPVTVNATYQQFLISFAKINHLIKKFGFDTATELIKNQAALSGILPSPLDVLAFPDVLTRLSPIALTLPLRRMGCTFHFQSTEGFWIFGNAETEGLFNEFSSALGPTSEHPSLMGLKGLKNMSEDNIWRYLRVSVGGINKLMKFINNPITYVDKSGNVDYLKQIQILGAIYLLFSDLSAMNFSSKSYNRISYAFSAMDKLANLRKKFSGSLNSESKIMQELASEDQGRELEQVFEVHLKTTNVKSENLLDALKDVVRTCYDNVHQHLRDELGSNGSSESARLGRLSIHRNLRHGTFLNKQQFEKLFLESKGTVPREIATLPFVLMLALALDPLRFFQFQPQVKN